MSDPSGIKCTANKDCSSFTLCVKEKCEAMTPANVAAIIPAWGWVLIVLAFLLIILGLVKCFCWPFGRSKSASKELKGPVPLPARYQKPVDLMEVAAAQRTADEYERKLSADSTVYPSSSVSNGNFKNHQMNASYEQMQMNASYGAMQAHPPDYDYQHQMGSQQGYNDNQSQYGYPNQKVYASNINQGYYGNSPNQYADDQMNYSNYGRTQPDYNYRPY